MTWIVGRAMPFGYAAGISDIRVTLADRAEHDCLQKVYPVGRFMAMGFAGSILIGFEMVSRLTQLLENVDPQMAWDPNAVAEWWPVDAREVFESFEEVDRKNGCELMLLSAHPTEHLGNDAWPRCFVHRFRAPVFTAELAGPSPVFGIASEAVSIGYGSVIEVYREALQHVGADFTQLQMEVGNPGGMAYGLMFAVRAEVERNPVPGISPQVQVCTVRRGNIDVGHYDRQALGNPARDLAMPPLATTPAELCQLLGGTAAIVGARC